MNQPFTPFRRVLVSTIWAAWFSLSVLTAADAPPRPRTPADKPPPPPAAIRVNTVGFLPDAPKQATLAVPCTAFRVVREADSTEVLSGAVTGPVAASPIETGGETLFVADFSALTAPGRYVLDVPGVGRSAPFVVDAAVWNEPYRLATRAMYLWRCGVAVHGAWQGQDFAHAPCHLGDGLLDFVGGPAGARRPATGGWHDAGDYNKYVVNAGVTVGLMFKAWEHFRPRIAGVPLDLPESGNGLPDLLNEIRFELEWLFTMQLEDGRVLHKVSARDFSYWGPPEKDESPRYFAGWGTTATADFAAMMALGARHFREFDPALADRCLAAARAAWQALAAHPENVEPEQGQFRTGTYNVPDATHRLWAAAELWETTGEKPFLEEFERRAQREEFTFGGPTWGDVRDLGLGTYLTSSHPEGRNPRLVWHLTGSLFGQVERILAVAATNPHARPFGGERASWFWGCNGSVAAQTYLLHLADRIRPDPRHRAAAQQALAHLFGRNYHGRSYVTGLGASPPQHPHDRRGEPAWPGYLVGGAWPDGRYWFDEKPDARTNEIAINWNGALIYALAAFVTE
jgi:endoglucanase